MFQLKLPVEISTIIEISDPVYTFCEVMDSIDLRKYLAAPESRTGRKRYNSEILLKVTLFAFMEYGYASVRSIEKLCKTDTVLKNNSSIWKIYEYGRLILYEI